MTKKEHFSQKPLSINPEDRIKQNLPAACSITETKKLFYCNFWWGREQEAGRRLIMISRLFPCPDPIPKGGGVFEEILFFLRNFKDVEMFKTEPREGVILHSDYNEAIRRIKELSVSAVITGYFLIGTDPKYADAVTCTVDFYKKNKPAK